MSPTLNDLRPPGENTGTQPPHPTLRPPFPQGISGNPEGRPKMRMQRLAREICHRGRDLVEFWLDLCEGQPFTVPVARLLPMTKDQLKVARGDADEATNKRARRQRRYVLTTMSYRPSAGDRKDAEKCRAASCPLLQAAETWLAQRGWGLAPQGKTL